MNEGMERENQPGGEKGEKEQGKKGEKKKIKIKERRTRRIWGKASKEKNYIKHTVKY